MFLPSNTALLALLANYNVENVSALDDIEGDTHTINSIFPLPLNESLNTLVNLEFLNGICVLVLSINADIQCPKHDKLPLIDVNSYICNSFSSGVRSVGILNFSDPAKSTILSDDSCNVGSLFITITYCNVI